MRSTTLRWIILVTTVAIALIVSAQLFWLTRIYNYEQKEFNTGVVKSIQGVYEDLELTNSPNNQLQKLIEKPDANTYLFKTDSIPDKDSLLDDLLNNLEDFEVFADCRVALYDTAVRKYAFDIYLPAAGTKMILGKMNDLPFYKKNYSYIRLYFPHRSQYIINSMRWWIVSGILLFIVLVALGLSIFYLYKQKFLNEIQNDFIQNVTHEFQTPLTTLIVGLDSMSKPAVSKNPEKFETYIRLMQAQTNYLKHHIENLMKVLKAEASGLVMSKENVSPNELVKCAVVQLRSIAEEKNASIELDLEPTNSSLSADKSSLYVAVLNIVSNALKYSNDPVVIIQTKMPGNKYLISVKDNGIGIDEKAKSKLFKKFYRIPSGNVHNVKGLGLGLYFTKKVVDEHKGSILVKSAVGKGSEFIIVLPLH